MQGKEKKRALKDVDRVEAEVPTLTLENVNNAISPVLEAGSRTNACG